MLVEKISYSLLSVSQICATGMKVTFYPDTVYCQRLTDDKQVFKGYRADKLYLVDFQDQEAAIPCCLTVKTEVGWLWHRRLGHVGMRNLKKLSKENHVLGINEVSFDKDKPCSACQAGKQHGVPHPPKNIMTMTEPFDLIHIDLFGPTTYESIGGNNYGFVIVDDISRFTWVFFLKDKTQVYKKFKHLIIRVQNEWKVTLKAVRSDNGT